MNPLTPSRETLIKLCRGKEKIPLIKEHRAFKNSGLKEAKEAIETAQSGDYADGTMVFDEGKILALFGYGPEGSNTLMAAFTLLNSGENWKILGFPTFKASVEAVLKNFA